MIGLRAGESDEVVGELESFSSVATVNAQLSLRIGFHADQRNGLPEASFGAGASQSQCFELFRDVQRSDLAALGARAAPFQSIIGKKFDMRSQGAFTYRARQIRARRNALRYCHDGNRKDNQTNSGSSAYAHTIPNRSSAIPNQIVFPVIKAIASARVRGSFRKPPSTAEVTVIAPGFFTPRKVMHVCSASITTITPRGCSRSKRVFAISEVRRSCNCRRRAKVSDRRASFETPRILPSFGM